MTPDCLWWQPCWYHKANGILLPDSKTGRQKNTIQEGSRIMKCEKCGHEIADRSTAQTICLECPNCGWGFATSLSQPLDEDMTDYKIYLNPGNTETMEHIKLISAICHVNYLQARKLLSSQKPVLIYKAEQEAASSLSQRQERFCRQQNALRKVL